MLLHRVDRRGSCRERLDGLTGRSEDALVLDGHLLELRRRHDALHLWLDDCGRAEAPPVHIKLSFFSGETNPQEHQAGMS